MVENGLELSTEAVFIVFFFQSAVMQVREEQ